MTNFNMEKEFFFNTCLKGPKFCTFINTPLNRNGVINININLNANGVWIPTKSKHIEVLNCDFKKIQFTSSKKFYLKLTHNIELNEVVETVIDTAKIVNKKNLWKIGDLGDRTISDGYYKYFV